MEKRKAPNEFDKKSRERLNFIIAKYCHGSQQELSKKTGIGQASLSQYANGKNTPSNLTALALCAPFRINPAWLQGFDVPMQQAANYASSKNSLTIAEEHLISLFRELNVQGQDKVVDYAADLVAGKQYIKTDQAELVDPDTSEVNK